MSRWFRVYDDLVDDPKVQRLSPERFRGLVNLWCLASKGGGVLPGLDEIAFKLRMSEQKAGALIAGLRHAGLLDEHETGLTPHNWSGRQHKHDSSNDRVKRHRERKRNAAVTVTATAPETETEKTEANASAGEAPAASEPVDDVDWLWSVGLTELLAMGIPDKRTRGLMGKWRQIAREDASKVREAIEECRRTRRSDPIGWVTQRLQGGAADGRIGNENVNGGRGSGRADPIDAAMAKRKAVGSGPVGWRGDPDDPRVIDAEWTDASRH